MVPQANAYYYYMQMLSEITPVYPQSWYLVFLEQKDFFQDLRGVAKY